LGLAAVLLTAPYLLYETVQARGYGLSQLGMVLVLIAGFEIEEHGPSRRSCALQRSSPADLATRIARSPRCHTSDRIVYLAEPKRFERVIIPSIAYNLHRAAAYIQRDTWERIGCAFDRKGGPERVYLSRSRYEPNRALINEAEVESRFQAEGFTVLHPQELSIAEQIATIRHARLIAGSAGSAMYLSAFCSPRGPQADHLTAQLHLPGRSARFLFAR
jgi:hypothetical protein